MRSLPISPTLLAKAPASAAWTGNPALMGPALRIRAEAGCPGWTGSPSSSGWPWPS